MVSQYEHGPVLETPVEGSPVKLSALASDTIARQHAEIEAMAAILLAIDHTLTLHGKVDADTHLHTRVRSALRRHDNSAPKDYSATARLSTQCGLCGIWPFDIDPLPCDRKNCPHLLGVTE